MNHKKNLFWAYLLLFFGGFFGLHQIYLGRFRHAFALWISFGGYFGLGLIRELWRMPEYVAEVNEDPQFIEQLIQLMRKQPRPSFGVIRYFASIVVADILGYLVMGAIPHEIFDPENGTAENVISRILIILLVPAACALGVHLVGNVGRYSGTIKWPLIAAYLTSPLYWFNVNSVFITSLMACIAFSQFSLEWRRTPLKSDQNAITNSGYGYLFFILCIIVYLSLWASWFYFNCTVGDTKNEEIIKCRVAIKNLFNSPAWLEFRTVMKNLWNFLLRKGIWGLWTEIVVALDPQGEQNALKILQLENNATQDQITSAYRKLARQWHPDKNPNNDEQKKMEAEQKFLEIQEAYNLLSNIRRKRTEKQKQF